VRHHRATATQVLFVPGIPDWIARHHNENHGKASKVLGTFLIANIKNKERPCSLLRPVFHLNFYSF
jgi:hypothetical protein